MVSSTGARWVKHMYTHAQAFFNTYSPAQTHTHIEANISSYKNHLPSFSFTSACLLPWAITSCYVFILQHTCAPTHAYTCLPNFVFSVWYRYCVCIVLCLHVFVVCVCAYIYISHHLPPFLQHDPPAPPVLSVPAGSKGGVSSTSLQRSRSDVDVNAAAVAKYRHIGQTGGAGRLPPGSYSSLGKGSASQVRCLFRQWRRRSACDQLEVRL